jgi:hypothetical protein
MAKMDTLGKVATKVETHGENTIITYHNTDVVCFDSNSVLLKTGGWATNTTKTRMNQASAQFNLGYHVYQKDFSWYVVTPKGETLPFRDDFAAFTR